MKRIIFALVFSLFSLSSFACTPVTSDSTPGFCTAFAQMSICECNSLGGSCATMQDVYSNMVGNYGPGQQQAIDGACEFGALMGWATKQNCEDQWHCYLNGGKDSHGLECYGQTGPGSYCQKLSSMKYYA